jgi:mevalonate kinase
VPINLQQLRITIHHSIRASGVSLAELFSIPGKTFLLGEYLALQGGPTLVALTQPCFQIKVQSGQGKIEGIHLESPAGKFIQSKSDLFEKYDLSFFDPYSGKGGFGASTAQFLASYAFWSHQKVHQHEMEKLFDYKHLLGTYTQFSWDGQGFAPSGADLIGQLKGSLTFFEKRRSFVSIARWPFSNLEFYLIHTGHKIATHEHLNSLAPFESAGLEKSFQLAKQSFESLNDSLFVEAVNSYAQELKILNLTCDNTLELLKDLKELEGVKAAKGCGALGADVILAVVAQGQSAELKKYCQHKDLRIMASDKDISSGLQMGVKEDL